jgi:hypothetical protein
MDYSLEQGQQTCKEVLVDYTACMDVVELDRCIQPSQKECTPLV